MPEQKNHYTVDEMMDRLKDVQAVKDGRGRKRRRSKQKNLEPNQLFQRTLVKVTIWLAVFVVIVAVVVAAVTKFNEFRYGGASFSQSVAERLSEISGLKVGLGKFVVDGRSIQLREAVISGDEGDFLKDVQLRGVQGMLEMRSYFGSEWYFNKFEVFEVKAVVGRATGDREPVIAAGTGGDGGGGGLGLASRPEALLPEMVRLKDCDFYWGEIHSGRGLEGVDVVAEVFSGETSVHANGGTLRLEGFPEWELQSLEADWTGGVLDIGHSRFTLGEREELKMSGEIDTNPGGGMALKGSLTRLAMSKFLPGFWAGKMDGFLESDFVYEMVFEEGRESELSGGFEIRDFVLRGLPVFDSLAIYAGEHGLGFMELPSVKGTFRRVGDVVTISDFESLQAGLLKMRGEITVTGGELGGVVELGLPDALFDRLGGGRPDLFELEDDGFAWAKMVLGGTLDAPTEDLSAKLIELTRQRSEMRATEARRATGVAAPKGEGNGAGGPNQGGGARREQERKSEIERAFESLINGQ